MNRRRRDALKTAVEYIERAKDIIDRIYDEEVDSLDNIPDNLQGSSRYEKMEDAASALDDATTYSDYVLDRIMSAIVA